MSKVSNQEKIALQHGENVVIIVKEIVPKKTKTQPTQEEIDEKLRLKREKEAARKRIAYQKKKEERVANGEPTILTPDALIKQSLSRQKRYQEDEEYRNKLKEKAKEYYHKTKNEKPKKAPKPVSERKKMGRPRKYTEAQIETPSIN